MNKIKWKLKKFMVRNLCYSRTLLKVEGNSLSFAELRESIRAERKHRKKF